jgi:DNA helicase-2/ATP-dependent DNA helicase PcrA
MTQETAQSSSRFLSGLNTAQKRAVEDVLGPVMVLAGAGSGKTKTLVSRIAYIIEELGISPFRVLALTFSNKAAREMRERISKMVTSDVGALQVTTFHSFCARLLRSEAEYLGLSKSFTIYDDSESKAIVKHLLERRGIGPKEVHPYDVLNYIDGLKNKGYYRDRKDYPDEIDKKDLFYLLFLDYENELRKANALDFGGLITASLELFEKYPDVLDRYQRRFEFLLVDEYQDTNRSQFDLVRFIAGEKRNVCVVGDEDQSIYSWRGADIRNILDFEEFFPDAKIFKLEQNYRSSRMIIEAATHVISRNTQRKGKSMWTENPDGEVIRIIENQDERAEADFVARTVSELRKQGTLASEIAVFYRANSQARALEDALRRDRIPYKVVGGVRFYERKEIKDLLAYIRLVVNPKDSLAFSRVVNVPSRGVGTTSLRKLEEEAISLSISLSELVERGVADHANFAHLKLGAKIKSALSQFVSLIQEARLMDERGEAPHLIYEKILRDSGYLDVLRSSRDFESMARIENLEELTSGLKQYESSVEKPSLAGFLETVTLDSSQEKTVEEDEAGEVSLMTVHGAKGLEFEYVFLAGCEENVFPSFKTLEGGEETIEEERRLFYVAMTRAMKRLYISLAQGRMTFGQIKFNGPSRFLYEIPEKFYDWKRAPGAARVSTSNNWDEESFFDQSGGHDDYGPIITQEKAIPLKVASKFPKGSKVAHGLYGEGVIVENEGSGPDEKVTICFVDGTKKKFLVKFTPLTVIS